MSNQSLPLEQEIQNLNGDAEKSQIKSKKPVKWFVEEASVLQEAPVMEGEQPHVGSSCDSIHQSFTDEYEKIKKEISNEDLKSKHKDQKDHIFWIWIMFQVLFKITISVILSFYLENWVESVVPQLSASVVYLALLLVIQMK
jgi:hypothetical protein